MGFTNKEQAARLAGLGMPAGTCDMVFEGGSPRMRAEGEALPENACPCWSGDRLFTLLPMEVEWDGRTWKLSVSTQKEDGMYIVSYTCGGNALSNNSTDFFGAVYAMTIHTLTYIKDE